MGKQESAQQKKKKIKAPSPPQKKTQQNNKGSLIQIPNICLFSPFTFILPQKENKFFLKNQPVKSHHLLPLSSSD